MTHAENAVIEQLREARQEITTACEALDGMRDLLQRLNPARMTTKEVRKVFNDLAATLEPFQLGSARIIGVLTHIIDQADEGRSNNERNSES